MSYLHASVSQGRICTDDFTCCHTEVEVADPTFYLTQSQYTDTGPTSPSADPIMRGAWQGSHWSANFEVTSMTRPGKIPSQAGFEARIFRSRGGRLKPLSQRGGTSSGKCEGNHFDLPKPRSKLYMPFHDPAIAVEWRHSRRLQSGSTCSRSVHMCLDRHRQLLGMGGGGGGGEREGGERERE